MWRCKTALTLVMARVGMQEMKSKGFWTAILCEELNQFIDSTENGKLYNIPE